MPILKIPPEWQTDQRSLPSVNEKSLPYGVWGNLETISVMRKVAHQRKGHPAIRNLALRILEYYQVPSQHHLDEAYAIGSYVQNKVTYKKDPVGIEQLHDPLTMIEQLRRGVAHGDCDDMSLLIATLLMSVGIHPAFRAVRYRTMSGPFNHIYVVVKEKNWRKSKKDLALDAIIKDRPMGFEVPYSSSDDFLV